MPLCQDTRPDINLSLNSKVPWKVLKYTCLYLYFLPCEEIFLHHCDSVRNQIPRKGLYHLTSHSGWRYLWVRKCSVLWNPNLLSCIFGYTPLPLSTTDLLPTPQGLFQCLSPLSTYRWKKTQFLNHFPNYFICGLLTILAALLRTQCPALMRGPQRGRVTVPLLGVVTLGYVIKVAFDVCCNGSTALWLSLGWWGWMWVCRVAG